MFAFLVHLMSVNLLFQGILLAVSIFIFVGSVVALGAIVSAKPLDDLGYKGWNGDEKGFSSPYASSVYLGWAIAAVIALLVTAVLPIVSWFATYRFSLSSAICVGVFSSEQHFFFCFSPNCELFGYIMQLSGILMGVVLQVFLMELSHFQ